LYSLFFPRCHAHRPLPSFPTRRSSDLTPPDHYPLLLHYHPLVIYRHQVIKQADLVLATFLLPDEFTPEQRKRIFDYYDPLTTGRSEEHTSELQSRENLVCRLLLEKKND